VLSKDGSGYAALGSRIDALYACEQVLATTRRALSHRLLLKAVKTIVPVEQQFMKEAQSRLTVPVHYPLPSPSWAVLGAPTVVRRTGRSCCRR